MAKLKKIDGKYYRMRRGKIVEIPLEWVGKTTNSQTILRRQSKKPPKLRKWRQQVGHLRARVARANRERDAIDESET